jgi:transposase-like protein
LPDGTHDVLGMWSEQTEGAKFLLKVLNDLRNDRADLCPASGP